MSKLVNTELAIQQVTRAKELIESRNWWKGIDGDIRQVIDTDGNPTGHQESVTRVSGYTLLGALTAARYELNKKVQDTDSLRVAGVIAECFIEAAIAKHCNGISYTLGAFNKQETTKGKKILLVLSTAIAAMKEQLR